VGLARALVYRPKVLLLDEPLSNLDAKLREEMRFEIKEVVTRLGITSVYVTHDQEEALALSDRVAIMRRGRLEQVATPEEIYREPASRFVAEFVGLSNFLEGHVEAVRGDGMDVRVGEVRLAAPRLPGAAPGQRVQLFARPSEIALRPAADPGPEPGVAGRIASSTYLGDRMDYRVDLGGGLALRVQCDAELRVPEGAPVWVHPRRLRCWAADPAAGAGGAP
jgi:iron(III) transport system ATP-binding protein